MKQVTQTLRTGVIEINEVPVPTLTDQFVLVRNSASVISAGTEKTKIDMGRKNLLQKARARPDLVKQVLKKLRTEGLGKTLQTVNSRLDSPSALGYSCAGSVIAVGGLVEGIQPGDRVACGGAGYANHADVVAVPKNLVVRIPDNVSDEDASFTTIGAIALQGVRLAEPRLGETFLVLGLGLIGQITVQLLRANGCTVIGTDLNDDLIKRAEAYGALGARSSDIERSCASMTAGHGVDGVLVCAGTASNEPIELCGRVTREKGRVVVVGAVRMDIPRDDFFRKEISVVISRSYGPGRYDPFYEENGNDYPLGYVRFTEQRNMQTFLQLLATGAVSVRELITHRFALAQAGDAYAIIEGERRQPYLGIVLNYPGNKVHCAESRIVVREARAVAGSIGISFLGAGNYATASLLPVLKQTSNVEFRGLATASGRSAQAVARQFGFGFCTEHFADLLDENTDVVFITTRHDTHAQAVVDALNAGKHVYVEKPLALSIAELAQVDTACKGASNAQLMVGFNRRFAPLTVDVRQFFAAVTSPLVINIRVNAGSLPKEHWIQDPRQGGGRIIGEGCHFVDLACAIANSLPVEVYAVAAASPQKSALLNDNVIISLRFASGSIASITYCADGSKAMSKEHIDVSGGGRSAVINDFRSAVFHEGDSKTTDKKQATQDKGQKAMLGAWIDALKSGKPCVELTALMASSMATILAVESLTTGTPLAMDSNALQQMNSLNE